MPGKFVVFLKSRLIFNVFCSLCMPVNKHFAYLFKVRIYQKVKCAIMRNLRGAIFCMKTNVLQDFYICIRVPLNKSSKCKKDVWRLWVLAPVVFRSVNKLNPIYMQSLFKKSVNLKHKPGLDLNVTAAQANKIKLITYCIMILVN